MAAALLRGFKPVRFRALFMLGALCMSIAALAAAGYAIHGVVVGSALQIGFNAALAVVLLVAVRGLLKMRTWGLMLGGLTSLGLLTLTPFYGTTNALTLTLAAIPALLFWVVPVLLAQRKPNVRVAVDYRVALEEQAEEDVADELAAGDELEAGDEPRVSASGMGRHIQKRHF